MPYRTLPCGCRSCGCLCESHSLVGARVACDAHYGAESLPRAICREALTLAALGLFLANLTVWAAILGGR